MIWYSFKTGFMARWVLSLLLLLTASVNAHDADKVNTFSSVPAQDGVLGSTMTLQQLQQARQKAEEIPEPIKVNSAVEPSPALKYRLYPARWELKPGSALLHFTRAQILFLQLPKETRFEWQMWFGVGKTPTDQELAAVIASLPQVFNELHDLAQSEDLTWDHRVRELRGPDVYRYLLPDVQEVRAMARMLRLRIKHQLKQQDFDGAVSTISDGVRLAEFAGQGETVVQKLVGIATMAIMRECIIETISTPGSPNLYWALASIPQPLINMSEAVLWELDNIQRVLPALEEAESATWSSDEATKKWASLVVDLGVLEGEGQGEMDHAMQLALVTGAGVFVDAAIVRLLAKGVPQERLAKMPVMQIVLLDASKELQAIGDDLGKGHLLPISIAQPLLEREDADFQEWIRKNRTLSGGAAIGGLLFPVVNQAKEAETRMLMNHNRLMTLEALRMHSAGNNGELPESLADLSPVPAMPDPYTGKAFEYTTERTDGQRILVLTAAGPLNNKPMIELRAMIVK